MCVCFHMYMCEFYMYMSEIINVFLLISCLVRFTFTLSQSPCWVSLLALTWKEKVRHTHTHTHVLRWESIKVIALSSKCPVWQRSHRRSNLSMQLILSQKQTSASDPPDRFELWPLPLRTLPLSPFFLSLWASKQSRSLIIVRLTGQEVERYYHLLKRALFIRHMTKNMELKCSLHSCIILETAILSDLYKDSFQMLIITDNAKNN